NGTGTFVAALKSLGNQTVTATDTTSIFPSLILRVRDKNLDIPLVQGSIYCRLDSKPGPTEGSYYLGIDHDIILDHGIWDNDLLILVQPQPDGGFRLLADHKE